MTEKKTKRKTKTKRSAKKKVEIPKIEAEHEARPSYPKAKDIPRDLYDIKKRLEAVEELCEIIRKHLNG